MCRLFRLFFTLSSGPNFGVVDALHIRLLEGREGKRNKGPAPPADLPFSSPMHPESIMTVACGGGGKVGSYFLP